jgi:formylglycine-generating enzyme required for sulfatase activity
MADDTRWYTDHTAETAFTVSTADELAGLADIVNGDAKGVNRCNFSGKTIRLAADIDLSGYASDGGWSPIGDKYVDVSDGIDDRVFAGTFDGGGHVVKNLTINRPDGHYQGLFGYVDGGVVRNIGLIGVRIRGENFVGGVAGYVAGGGSVVKSYCTGEAGGRIAVGGIAGVVDGGKVDNCYSAAAVSGENEVGGVVGSVRSVGGSVTDSAALNPSVKSTRKRPDVGRVVGKKALGAALSNNAAYAEMKNGADSTEWPADQALNGEAVTADQIKSDKTIGGRFKGGGGWTITSDMLPGGAAPPPPVPPPAHISVGADLAAAPLRSQQPSAAEPEISGDGGFTDPIAGDMVAVTGGTFMMGATAEQGGDCYDDEKPAHAVILKDYYIGKYLVTQRLWKRIMAGTPVADPSKFKGDDLPVETVSWKDIVDVFLIRLKVTTGKAYRLPTEAEWEYAARGGVKSKGYKYAGSNDIDKVAWYGGNSGRKTHIVGTKAQNELGIYDMSGNIWEWVSDWYGKYRSDSRTNPTGAAPDAYRVNRGGSWSSAAANSRVSSRRNDFPEAANDLVGFRLALTR